jgi:hypothetical protein
MVCKMFYSQEMQLIEKLNMNIVHNIGIHERRMLIVIYSLHTIHRMNACRVDCMLKSTIHPSVYMLGLSNYTVDSI